MWLPVERQMSIDAKVDGICSLIRKEILMCRAAICLNYAKSGFRLEISIICVTKWILPFMSMHEEKPCEF